MRIFTIRIASLFFLLFNAIIVNAQIGEGYWSYSNPKPFGFYSNAVAYGDDNNGLVVGEAGGVAKTTDGGGTWTYFSFRFTDYSGAIGSSYLNDVQFLNTSIAYLCGSNGALAKSTDGGLHWSLMKSPFYDDGSEINTVFFLDENIGYIGGDADFTNGATRIYKTIDGGNSWVAEPGFPTMDYSTIYKIRFSKNGIGYATGANGLIKKWESGAWKDYSLTPATIYPNVNSHDTAIIPHGYDEFSDTLYTVYEDNIFGMHYQNIRGIAILDDTSVVVSSQNNGVLVRINTSTPAGAYLMLNNSSALHQKYNPLQLSQVYNLAVNGTDIIAGATSEGALLLSEDKGYNWRKQQVYPESSGLAGVGFFGVAITPSKRFAVCGAGGIIADSLSSWRRPYTTPVQYTGPFGAGIDHIAFIDPDNGLAVGSNGFMLRTKNGGDTWENISKNIGFYAYFTSAEYKAPDALFLSASNGTIYKSTDGGTSIDLLFTEPDNGNIVAMNFLNTDTGWMAVNTYFTDPDTYETTYGNRIYKTTDAGENWLLSNTSFPAVAYQDAVIFDDIKFADANTGYLLANNGRVYKSTDGGDNWLLQTNVPEFVKDKTMSSLSVTSTDTVYASGWAGTVMKTTDGGTNWVMANNGLPSLYTNYMKVLMYDNNQGMVFGNGSVFTTKDGGNNWSVYYAPVQDGFAAACFAPVNGCSPESICKKVFAGSFFTGKILKFDADRVLPVKFSKLTGTRSSAGNQLFFTAFTQDEVKYFEVQRSVDGIHFGKTGSLIYPNGQSHQSHKWLDVNALAGKNYYRIKSYEKNGMVSYTNVVLISFQSNANWAYQLNNNNLILTNPQVIKGKVQVQVYNATGQSIAVKSWNQDGGAFNGYITLPVLAKGVYLVKINNEGAVNNIKIFVP